MRLAEVDTQFAKMRGGELAQYQMVLVPRAGEHYIDPRTVGKVGYILVKMRAD